MRVSIVLAAAAFAAGFAAAPAHALVWTNALTSNALTSNSLTANSLTANSLTANSLTANALTSNALDTGAPADTRIEIVGLELAGAAR